MYCDTWVWILPLLLIIWIPFTFFTTYGIALKYKHVEAYWPYISDTGTYPPESCYFAQFLNLAAFLLCFIVYFRYRQVREWASMPRPKVSQKANIVSLVLGLISCLGLDMVANFQETNVVVGHFLGAFLCFIPGTIYSIMQMIFTRRINKNARKLFFFRLAMATISIIATIGYMTPPKFALEQFNGKDKLHWKPKDGGYALHITSTSMEWIVVFSYVLMIGSLYFDFRNLKISEPHVEVLNLRDRDGRNVKRQFPMKNVYDV